MPALSVSPGQWDAGLSLGITHAGVLRHIILPKALRMMLPSFINQWISLIEDTSLAYIVGVGVLSFVAAQVNSREMIYSAEIFIFIGVIHFLLCGSLDVLASLVARRWRTVAAA